MFGLPSERNQIRKTVITNKSLDCISKHIHCQGTSSLFLEESRQTRQRMIWSFSCLLFSTQMVSLVCVCLVGWEGGV